MELAPLKHWQNRSGFGSLVPNTKQRLTLCRSEIKHRKKNCALFRPGANITSLAIDSTPRFAFSGKCATRQNRSGFGSLVPNTKQRLTLCRSEIKHREKTCALFRPGASITSLAINSTPRFAFSGKCATRQNRSGFGSLVPNTKQRLTLCRSEIKHRGKPCALFRPGASRTRGRRGLGNRRSILLSYEAIQ